MEDGPVTDPVVGQGAAVVVKDAPPVDETLAGRREGRLGRLDEGLQAADGGGAREKR